MASTASAHHIFDARFTFSISSEKELELLFDELRWGTREWPATEEDSAD